MAELHLRFDKELEGKTLAENEGVLTNIYPATSAASKSVQTLGSRGARNHDPRGKRRKLPCCESGPRQLPGRVHTSFRANRDRRR